MTDPDLPVPADAGRSWWLREALARPEFEGEPAPPLDGDTTADVVILGGGYTGLWTALHLKELDPGADVVVLEQDICGGGPSGRNGGFVSSFWDDLPHLAEAYGDEMALRICRVGDESVTAIGAFCEANGIDAWFLADGALGVATSESQVGAWADQVITADRLGVGNDLEVLDAAAARARVDSPVVFGGVFVEHGATAQPARLARGMRRVAMERGVRIYEGSPVTRFGAGSPSVAETPDGSVRAGAAVLALNAWAARMKRFRRAITVRGSYIVMTAPAPEKLDELQLDRWPRRLRLPRRAPLPAHDAGRAHRLRDRGHAAEPRPHDRATVRLRRARDPRGDRRPPPDVPDVPRTCRSTRAGAARSTSRARTSPSSARSRTAPCTTASGTRATGSAPRISAGGSWRCARSAATRRCSTCPSSTPTRCASRRSRSSRRGR